jgi:glycosyltransferase involved in cell wall biosynthesis
MHLVYHDLPFASRWEGGHLDWQLYYYLWQISAYFVARRLHYDIGLDLTHHVTFGKYWGPSFLSLLPIPFVWGPVGGGDTAPRAFWRDLGARGIVYEALRYAACWVGEHDPFTRLTARQSSPAIVTTPATADRLKSMNAKHVEHLPGQTGLSQPEIERLGSLSVPASSPVRFVSIGRLLHWKGFHLGLRAFARACLPDAQYWIIGDGAERKRLQSLARELGIEGQVWFWGSLSRENTLHRLGDCHVLVHPALHDFSPTVCLEAMAAGRPVVCLDLGGPATQITHKTGIKVPARDPEQAVVGMSAAMRDLAGDEGFRRRLGEQGKQRVEATFSWSVKAESLTRIYREALNGS